MDKPLVHPSTEVRINRLATGRHHAVALVGPYGAGKAQLAKWLALELLKTKKLNLHNFKHITPEKNTIGIDSIRQLQNFLKLKSTGESYAVRRIILIEDAQVMTIEAQNALLKSLEEPPADTRIILSVVGEHSLLPTIYSRLQIIQVLPVTIEQALSKFSPAYTEIEIRKAHALSGGYAGLCAALLEDSDHGLNAAINEAKKMVNQSSYEKLLNVERLAKDKEASRLLLFALKRVLSAALIQERVHKNPQTLNKLVRSLRAVHAAEAAYEGSPNAKLALTDVMLHL